MYSILLLNLTPWIRKSLRVMRQGQGGSGRKGFDVKVQGLARSSAEYGTGRFGKFRFLVCFRV